MTEAAASAFQAQYIPPFVDQAFTTPKQESGFLPTAARTAETQSGSSLTLEQELVITKHLAEISPDETIKFEAFDKALRIMQRLLRGSTANSMPTAMKLKSWEVPLLQYALEFSAKSPDNRRVVVRRLVENLETGSGFFSVNRSKQGLKVIAKKTGLATLEAELQSDKDAARRAAAHLLGWSKHEKAVLPLLRAFCQGARSDRRFIGRVLKHHYSHLAPFYAHRHMPEFKDLVSSLIAEEGGKTSAMNINID